MNEPTTTLTLTREQHSDLLAALNTAAIRYRTRAEEADERGETLAARVRRGQERATEALWCAAYDVRITDEEVTQHEVYNCLADVDQRVIRGLTVTPTLMFPDSDEPWMAVRTADVDPETDDEVHVLTTAFPVAELRNHAGRVSKAILGYTPA